VGDESDQSDRTEKILWIIIAILIAVIFLMLSKIFDLYKYIPDTNTLSFSGAFLVWIIASLSTCLAITGGIIIWFSKYMDATHSVLWHIKVQLWFQVGRILWFFLLGGILWLTGQLLNISFSFTGVFTFVIWILLLYMWCNILGILPSLSKFGVHMPKGFAHKIEALWKPQYAPIVWALTFFLPCGFTQTMQLLAVSSGSFWSWWLVMLFFALGTFPVLWAVWLGSSYFNDKKLPLLNTLIASILIFFWITTLSNSYNLLAFSAPSSRSVVEQEKWAEQNNLPTETIKVWHDGWNTDPMDIVLEKGKNYKVVITPETNGKWCMSTQLIPKLKSKVSYVRQGEDIIYDLNNPLSGTYEIVCASMWMLQWRIIIK
jgi:sulfite exporter TauE/SafE